MTTENTVNTATGEIVPAAEFSQRDIAGEIVSINQGSAAFYSSIKGDDMDSKLAVASALSNAESLSDNLNQHLAVKDIIVQHVELVNEKGQLESAPRITIITADGKAYSATSIGVFSAVKQLLGVVGEPETWTKPIDMFAVSEKGNNGYKYTTLKYGKPAK